MPYETLTAQVYDLYFPPDRSPEVDRWVSLARRSATHLLEPMVGTAEVATLLARRGYWVTGVDISLAMLDAARQRLAAETRDVATKVTLLHSDIAKADLPAASFDFAYVGNGSWHLLTQPAQRTAALAIIHDALRPGGALALELFQPITESGQTTPRTHAPLRPPPHGVEVSKTAVVTRDAEAGEMRIAETIRADSQQWHHTIVLKILPTDELTAELRQAGYCPVSLSGPNEPNAPGDGRQIVVACKPSRA